MSDDQDFFFDEEETPAEKPERSAQATSASNRPKAPSRSTSAPVASAERTVSVTITALVGVVALLAGVIIGVLVPSGAGDVPAPTATDATAPQLTEEELQSGLPAGHPDIGAAGGQSAVPTGTSAATETTTP